MSTGSRRGPSSEFLERDLPRLEKTLLGVYLFVLFSVFPKTCEHQFITPLNTSIKKTTRDVTGPRSRLQFFLETLQNPCLVWKNLFFFFLIDTSFSRL